MPNASRHRPVGSFLSRSRAPARPALEALEARIAPAVYTVDRSTDLAADGSGLTGSLRYCLEQANKIAGADTINIATTQPIVLESQLQITDSVTIAGASGLSSITRDAAAPLFGLFDITYMAGKVSLTNLELTGGHATSAGGAVSNAADLTLQRCSIHDNAANETGGGVYTTGRLTVIGCTFGANSVASGGYGGGVTVDSVSAVFTGTTFAGNSADRGGGVYFQAFGASAALDFRDCTFSGNRATAGDGGAVATLGGEATITANFFDCTLADNTSSNAGGVGGVFAYTQGANAKFNYQGTLFANNSSASLGSNGSQGINYFPSSLGNNLSTDGVGMSAADVVASDPGIGPLGDYGGPTPTIPLLAHSPALDAGVVVAGLGTDQRGVSRPQGSAPDIGAFESRPQQIALSSGDEFATEGAAFSRAGSATVDGVAQVYVDYGDASGAPPSFVPFGVGHSFTLSHAYAAEGTYDVTVTLADAGGVWTSASFVVQVFLSGVDTSHIDQRTTEGPGIVTARAADPIDTSNVTATLLHVSQGKASILVAVVPSPVAASLNGSFRIEGNTITSSFDVRATGVGIDDEILVVFHYVGNATDQPVLRYFDRVTGQERVVESDTFLVDPSAQTITLVLDNDSTPGILDLQGTVFTIAVPLAVPAPDPTVMSLPQGGGGGGFGGADGGAGGASASTSAASFQVTGNQTFVAFASYAESAGAVTGEPLADRAVADRANLLADLPVVPDSLITLPGPILTPGSSETPIPNESPKVTTPPDANPPATSRLAGPEEEAIDEVFVRFDGGAAFWDYRGTPPAFPSPARERGILEPSLALRAWKDGGEGGISSLALVAFLAARPAGPRRRWYADAPVAR